MDLATTYLFEKLSEVFGPYEKARVSLVQPSGTQRAVDLPQDYDPKSSNLHSRYGVMVRIGGREFHFDASLVSRRDFAAIDRLTQEAMNWLESQND